jgi:hypothetical protein
MNSMVRQNVWHKTANYSGKGQFALRIIVVKVTSLILGFTFYGGLDFEPGYQRGGNNKVCFFQSGCLEYFW